MAARHCSKRFILFAMKSDNKKIITSPLSCIYEQQLFGSWIWFCNSFRLLYLLPNFHIPDWKSKDSQWYGTAFSEK